MKKKILSAAAAVIGLSALMSISASAQEAQYTDIDTYINHYPINAYGIDGKLAVVAEDLRDYGFNVDWDEDAWALHISRNDSISQLTRKDIYKPSQSSGAKFSDIYRSTISVDYNGIPMEGYALNGYTLIIVNELAALAGTEEWNEDNRYYNVWIDGLSTCEYKPLTQRCQNLWYSSDYNRSMPDLDFWDDVNSDEQDEHIKFSVIYPNNGDYIIKAKLSLNDKTTGNIYDNGMEVFNVQAVYLMDLQPNDNTKELAIFTTGEDSSTVIHIYKLKSGVPQACNFYLWKDYKQSYDNDTCLWGFNNNNYTLTLNDDNSITVAQKTSSFGMWSLYKTYKYDDYGSIVEVKPDVYTVIPNSWSYRANPWGYYPVYQSVYGRGLALNAGDYITPVYDDDNNNIYIRKSNGEEGWFSIDSYHYGSGTISPMFQMAG